MQNANTLCIPDAGFAFCILNFELRHMSRAVRYLIAVLLVVLCATPSAQSPRLLVNAVKRGDHAAVKSLLRGKTIVNEAEADGTTALHFAVQANDVELVQLLIGAGADVKVSNR